MKQDNAGKSHSRKEIAYVYSLHKSTVLSVHHFKEMPFYTNYEK